MFALSAAAPGEGAPLPCCVAGEATGAADTVEAAAGVDEAPGSVVIAAAGDAIMIAPEMERAGSLQPFGNWIRLRFRN